MVFAYELCLERVLIKVEVNWLEIGRVCVVRRKGDMLGKMQCYANLGRVGKKWRLYKRRARQHAWMQKATNGYHIGEKDEQENKDGNCELKKKDLEIKTKIPIKRNQQAKRK